MSLNTAHANGGVLIYSAERILIYYDGIEMGFEMDNSNIPQFKGKKKGRAYLTTHRIIFNSKDAKDTLQSFSIPFYCMKEVELEQPVFGANYIKGKVQSEPGGNWEGTGKWKMWFNHGGAIEFGKAMLQAGRLASRYAPPQPPAYKPPSAPFYQAPPPAYAPPQSAMYGFVPYQTFPEPPPYNTVYMMQEPPPYPGIDPNLQPYYPPGGQPQGGYQPTGANGYPAPPPAGPNGYPAAAPPPNYPAAGSGPAGYPQQGGYPAGSGPAGYPQQGGGYPQQGGYPPAPYPQNGTSKHTEAMGGGNAYYNPSNPHNVYMPPGASAPPPVYGEAPPSYDQAHKKTQ